MFYAASPYLNARQRDELPDSSFAIVLSGRKDTQGKTIPRQMRLFPYRDSSGEIIEPEAHRSLREINEGTVRGLTTAQRVEAWGKIVAILQAHYKKRWKTEFVPPPRKF